MALRIDPKMGSIYGLVLLGIAVVLTLPPIAQDPAYHNYADQRQVFGIPNFWNVVSNLPFILLGILGVSSITMGKTPGFLPELRPIYITVFAGVFLTGWGSAYYHMDPSNATIVWDRLALTILFMAVFSSVWGEHISVGAALRMVLPLICAGLLSVAYWYVTENQGRGDLRFYAVIQFLPMVLLPLIMLMYRSKLSGVGYVWGLLLAYTVAKVAEGLDGPLYRSLAGFSGHEIKHWVAALGIFIYYLAGFRRRMLSSAP